MRAEAAPNWATPSDLAAAARELDVSPAELAVVYARAEHERSTIEAFEAAVGLGPFAPRAARAVVTDWLTGQVSDGVLADARLLVSELVSNSLQHGQLAADALVRIRAQLGDDVLRLEVGNPGRDGTIERRTPDATHGGGYGLHLLEVMATRWGVNRTAGTQVWFELRVAAA